MYIRSRVEHCGTASQREPVLWGARGLYTTISCAHMCARTLYHTNARACALLGQPATRMHTRTHGQKITRDDAANRDKRAARRAHLTGELECAHGTCTREWNAKLCAHASSD